MSTSQKNQSLSLLPASKAITIFCGVCGYDEQSFRLLKQAGKHRFSAWSFHVNPRDLSDENILRLFGDYYYESFISSIFPNFKRTDKNYFNPDFAEHTHRLSKLMDLNEHISIASKSGNIEKDIHIDYMDIYLFPGNIAIYCFKCDFSGMTYNDITLLINYIRNNAASGFSFIREQVRWLTSGGPETENTLVFGNKLKSFTLIEMEHPLGDDDEKNLLYDLATCSPIGSASGQSPFFQPTRDYLDLLWSENTINVFDNWKGMCLFDSFTGLFRKDVLNNFIWENAYFNLIFLHSIYIKNYLFRINRKFYLEDSDKQKLEDEFYEFDQYFNFKQISFNFLPQIIYDKIRFGLDIEDELQQLQTSIERTNNLEKNRRDKKINNVLAIIAFLTVFSVIWDGSEWINKMFFNSTRTYNIISGVLTVAVLLLISMFFMTNFRKKR
jgi:hypothetical protein